MICLKTTTFVVSTTVFPLLHSARRRCDLLENYYLCSINNSQLNIVCLALPVVICLKTTTFVVSTTVPSLFCLKRMRCDLLENYYLCSINNSQIASMRYVLAVVICLKTTTFVVSTTVPYSNSSFADSCDLLENYYLCSINNSTMLIVSFQFAL